MTTWNVQLTRRKVIIIVKQILQKWPKHAAGFPAIAMEILDQEGRKHTFTAEDSPTLQWDKIQEGSKIELTLRESVVGSRVLE